MKRRTLDVYKMRARLTTLPPRYAAGTLAGVPEAWRGPAGPPMDGLTALSDYLTGVSTIKLCLMAISAEQRQLDGSQWFDGAFEYIERVAGTVKSYGDLFKGLEFTPEDLLTRQGRVKLLRNIITKVRSLLDQLEGTLYMEEADLLYLADVPMKMLDAQLTIADPATASQLLQISDVPLDVWRKRQETLKRNKDLLERARTDRQGEIDAANRRAEAAETVSRIQAGQPVSPEEVASLGAQPSSRPLTGRPAAARPRTRTGRSRRRDDQ